MIFILLLLLAVLCFKKYKKRRNKFLTDDLVWLLVPWSLIIIFYLYGGIEYESKLDIYSTTYLILCLLVFLLFRKIGLMVKIRDQVTNGEYNKVNTWPLFLIAFISGIILLLYSILNNNITFGVTRNLNTNMFTTVLHFLSCASLIVWLYDLAYSLKNGIKMRAYSYISILVYCIQPLLISGRESIVIAIFLTITIYMFYKGNKNEYILNGKNKNEMTIARNIKKMYKKFNFLGVIMIFLIMYYFLFLSSNRYGKSMISLFEWSANCKISKGLLNVTDKMGVFGLFLLNFIYYYSSSISKFAFIFKYYDGPYLYGLFQFNIISRRLPKSWHLDYIEVLNSADNLMRNKGFSGLHSIWDTGVGYGIYDFGRGGAIMEIAIWGIIVGIIVKKFRKNESIINLIYLDFICVGLFVTSMYSPIFSYGWLFPVIWLWFFDKYYSNWTIVLKK